MTRLSAIFLCSLLLSGGTGCSDDAGSPQADLALTDMAPSDMAQLDKSLSDRSLSDRSLSDKSLSDKSLSDKSLSDMAPPDSAPPDMAQPDMAKPDMTPPDMSGDGPVLCPMAGQYSINPSGSGNQNFKTFKDALVKLKSCGVSAAVTVSVAAGTYKESGFSFPPITGASATNTITFQAASGAKVKLEGSTGKYIIQIEAKATHYTISGFEMDGSVAANYFTTSYSGPIVFNTTGGQQNITLRKLHIHDFLSAAWAKASTYMGGIYMQLSAPVKNIHIDGCRFEKIKPTSAFHTQGAISLRRDLRDNLRITGNTFIGIGNMDAINLRDGSFSNLLVANNLFVVEGAYGAAEFYSSPTLIGSNNMFVHNTVVVTSSSGYGIGGSTSSSTKWVVQNNIFQGPSGAKATFLKTASTTASTPGYNCLYNATAGYTTGTNDVLSDPQINSASSPYDLHIKSTSPCVNKALLLSNIKVDFDGQSRGTKPDIGADEVVTSP